MLCDFILNGFVQCSNSSSVVCQGVYVIGSILSSLRLSQCFVTPPDISGFQCIFVFCELHATHHDSVEVQYGLVFVCGVVNYACSWHNELLLRRKYVLPVGGQHGTFIGVRIRRF